MVQAESYDVVVVGAGVAGLAVSRALAEAGKTVLLLEARERIGGRVWSIQAAGSGLPVELGAEFVHGRPPELWQLIEEAGLRSYELDGRQIFFEDGALKEWSRGEAFSVFKELSEDEPDLSFSEWVARKDIPEETMQAAIGFVEGFNAADAGRIGTVALAKQRNAEAAVEGGRIFRITDGYSALANHLLREFEGAGGQILLSTVVEAINWDMGSVRVATRNSDDSQRMNFSARQCVVTLPLGVLQSGDVRFDPEPQSVMRAAARLAMGSARRITYFFREPFWKERAPQMSFLFSSEGTPRVWWTPLPSTDAQITGWIAGPNALASERANDEDFAQAGLRLLAKMFGTPESRLRPLLTGWHSHDWQRDPFSLGAYSYAPKGAVNASEAMTEPVQETLFFAGEHTDTTGHWGTVHAALRSGLRAAQQILKQ